MKSLISRESYRREERYSGVYQIQGGMVTDADLNERSRITQDRTDHLGDDTIKDGVPSVGGAVAIGAGNALSLQEGVIYADGVRGILKATAGADLTAPLALFSAQADFPSQSPVLPSNVEQIIYADIWERPVYPLEDPYLADAGLHGAVTAFRTRTMTQLKAAPLTALAQIENGTGAFPQIGTGKLAVTPLNAEILADDCDPCADVVSAEQTIANALWRLEVIDVTGTPVAPGAITLAWSIENAAPIATSDVTQEDFERSGKVYEFFSEITESHLGVFAAAADAKRSAFVDDLSTTPTPATDHNGQPWPFVRRWDGQAVINTGTATVTSSMGGGFQISVAGQTVTLRVDAFEVALDLIGAAVVAGDYWLVELRRFAPEADRIRLVKETPVGVIHHYCTLFRVSASGAILPPTDAEIRKLSFPVLSNLPATHVEFDNKCEKLYADAENVQEALDNLCDISADDIAFESNCPELYDEAGNVQEALDALCKIDFSVHASFRLMFDWGVLCGLVPSLVKAQTGEVDIPAGALMDRSGRITRFEGGTFDLSKLELKKEILFDSEEIFRAALLKGEACLALAAQEGGKVSVHVIPHSLAFGPDDPGFRESALKCLEEKEFIKLDDTISKLAMNEQVVANRILLASSGDGAFSGSAKLTEAEAKDAASFNDILFKEYMKVASKEETEILNARREKAKQDNPLGNTQGAARQVRQMQQAMAVFTAFTWSDDERMRRCLCEALFPPCPPELGKAPYFVPIACLRGDYDPPGVFLDEVCPFCCRKQAMTWRALQYFIGESREKVAKQLSTLCCIQDEKDDGFIKPGVVYDPDFYKHIEFQDIWRKFKEIDPLNGLGPKPPVGGPIKILVNDLSEAEARKTLLGNGIDVTEIIDIDDEKAFELIESKSVGVTNTERLIAGESVRPGDKVGLLLQDGVARGYVLLERGSGKLPFPTQIPGLGVAISEEDELKAAELIAAANAAKSDLTGLVNLSETLSADVAKLKSDVEALSAEREITVAAVAEAEIRFGELAKSRTEITKEIEEVNKELAAAEVNRETIVTTLRRNQPVTTVAGNENPELIAKLAGEGITSVADISELTDAKIRALRDAGIINVRDAGKLKKAAETFLTKPIG